MADNTNIEWTDATVNFWWGCTKVGPGCDHCYAETWSKRTGETIWGQGVPRRQIKSAISTLSKLNAGSEKFFAENRRRRQVFIQSMSDLFDKEVPLEWFAVAWGAIWAACDIDVQIVTKRLPVIEKRLAALNEHSFASWAWPKNAGLIISVVNQEEADRDIPRLLELKAKLGIPWVGLSMEPLLGPVDLTDLTIRVRPGEVPCGLAGLDALTGVHWDAEDTITGIYGNPDPRIDWIIVGGESGPGARPMHPAWVRSIRDQCAAAGVPFFFKQWGDWEPYSQEKHDHTKFDPTVAGRQIGGSGPEQIMVRVGKKRAGRLLDGVEHNGMPEVNHA